jgi:tRNA modification GTPase
LWRHWLGDTGPGPGPGAGRAAARDLFESSARLDRLIDPASVVVVGRPNVGKSTLTNAMLGRSVSIVADLPGTTRDWVAGLALLLPPSGSDPASSGNGVTVRWMDTPGLHETGDPVERDAIELARSVIQQADVLIALRDPMSPWPGPEELSRAPGLWVLNKCDLIDTTGMDPVGIRPGHETTRESPLAISAQTGQGIDTLQRAILTAIGLGDLSQEDAARPWAFSARLRDLLAGGLEEELHRYIHGDADVTNPRPR